MGYDPESRTIAPGGPLAVATREQTLKIVSDFLVGQGLSGEKAERIARESFQLADRELGWEELIRPMEGLTLLLNSLRGKEVTVACLTNDEHRRARAILEFLKIAEFFQLVLGGDEVSRPKPDAEMIKKHVDGCGFIPREIVYIGDTVSDMIMAKRAGAGLAVAVLGGAADESILAAEADVVIPNLTAISVSGETLIHATKKEEICRQNIEYWSRPLPSIKLILFPGNDSSNSDARSLTTPSAAL